MNDDSYQSESRRLIVLDTTLRDGEQAPGFSLRPQEKLLIARELADLGVDVIEAGFAYSSRGEFESLRAISSEVEGPVICSLARAKAQDIHSAHRALEAASLRRVNIFHPTSDIQLRHQIGITQNEALERSVEMVQYARSYFDDVEFCPMDATRTDREYLFEFIEAVIEAGATTVNIADTVGYSLPGEFGALISSIRSRVGNIQDSALSVHCHNDLGMALANTLAGILSGADQVEVTFNGMGERAGNCSLASMVSVLGARPEIYCASTGIKDARIAPLGRLMHTLWGSGIPLPRLKGDLVLLDLPDWAPPCVDDLHKYEGNGSDEPVCSRR